MKFTQRAYKVSVFFAPLLICFILNGLTSFADPKGDSDGVDKFCAELTKPEVQDHKNSLKKIGSVYTQVLFPSKMIQVLDIDSKPKHDKTPTGDKYIFILFPKGITTKEEEQILEKRKSLLIDFKKTGILKKLAFSQLTRKLNFESCMKILKENPEDYQKAKIYLDFATLPSTHNTVVKTMNGNIYPKIDHFFKKFTDEGWKLSKLDNYSEILSILHQNKNISQIMLITHAQGEISKNNNSNSGSATGSNQLEAHAELVNSNGSTFDKRFFSALPNSVDKVILFTCHSRDIIKEFKLDQGNNSFDLYFAEPSERFKNIANGTTPINSRNAFLDVARNKVTVRTKSSKQCLLKLDAPMSNPNYTIEISSNLIGTIYDKNVTLPFDCNLIEDKYTISIRPIINPDIPKSSPGKLIITITKPDGSSIKVEPENQNQKYPPNNYIQTLWPPPNH